MKESTVTPKETVEAMLQRSGRSAVPIRKVLIRRSPAGHPLVPGPLTTFIRNGDESGFDLLLLARAVISEEPWDMCLNAHVWARALSHTGRNFSTVRISKIWGRLEQRNQIKRQRLERLLSVTLLHENGSGEPYTRPGKGNRERYLKLPHEYWTKDWCRKLHLPAKAMLLVALSLTNGFYMPVEKVPEWYGFSADSASRGLKELRDENLLVFVERTKKAPLAPSGFTQQRYYTLKGDFSLPTSEPS